MLEDLNRTAPLFAPVVLAQPCCPVSGRVSPTYPRRPLRTWLRAIGGGVGVSLALLCVTAVELLTRGLCSLLSLLFSTVGDLCFRGLALHLRPPDALANYRRGKYAVPQETYSWNIYSMIIL